MATAIATSVPMEIEISAPTPEDTLAVQELSLFGSVFDEIGLPAPPYDPNKDYGLGPGVGAAARRQFVANANRAKRPKNVKLRCVFFVKLRSNKLTFVLVR